MCLMGPTHRLVSLADLDRAYLLGGWSSRTASFPMFLAHGSRFLGGCPSRGLDGPVFLVVFCGKDLFDVL
jgi:hypothetical protein